MFIYIMLQQMFFRLSFIFACFEFLTAEMSGKGEKMTVGIVLYMLFSFLLFNIFLYRKNSSYFCLFYLCFTVVNRTIIPRDTRDSVFIMCLEWDLDYRFSVITLATACLLLLCFLHGFNDPILVL